ncbi:hypothetical protein CCACVL1_25439 [Corchorus capsularis]|uniref:Tetratricopeptide-like helical n=1 Tax=Corchorus capsularis TaxID=210143 RepID=A0A1R3GKG7_COCAP|nr:hypothetical protein CCACVL1_25439 [Corchorus capsularis]
MGLQSSSFCEGALIDMYSKCNLVTDARRVFDGSMALDTVSWTSMIAGYVQVGLPEEALKVFESIQKVFPVTDQVAVITIINAFVSLGRLDDACALFSQMPYPNVVAWNVLISGHAKRGYEAEAIEIFQNMRASGVKSTRSTLGSVLSAIASLAALRFGLLVHAEAIKQGLNSNVYVGSSLISMYAKCEKVDAAKKVFDELDEKNVVLWNAMLGGYAQNGYDVLPDQATFVSVLRACAILSSLPEGKQIHTLIYHTGYGLDELTTGALVDMYAKCGEVKCSAQVFVEMKSKNDVFGWNSMIVAFAKNGYAEDALRIFVEMQQKRVMPDDVTFLGVLTACSHAGKVSEGRQIFDMMVNYGIEPRVDHCACIVDLLGRCGFLKEAEDFIDSLKFEPDARIWAALLGACRIHGDEIMGRRVAEKLIELEPQNSSSYVLLANIYAASGNWDEANALRKAMRENGVQKFPGCSWIVVGQKTNLFVAGDKSHPKADEIEVILKDLVALMREDGYAPEVNSVLDEEE